MRQGLEERETQARREGMSAAAGLRSTPIARRIGHEQARLVDARAAREQGAGRWLPYSSIEASSPTYTAGMTRRLAATDASNSTAAGNGMSGGGVGSWAAASASASDAGRTPCTQKTGASDKWAVDTEYTRSSPPTSPLARHRLTTVGLSPRSASPSPSERSRRRSNSPTPRQVRNTALRTTSDEPPEPVAAYSYGYVSPRSGAASPPGCPRSPRRSGHLANEFRGAGGSEAGLHRPNPQLGSPAAQ